MSWILAAVLMGADAAVAPPAPPPAPPTAPAPDPHEDAEIVKSLDLLMSLDLAEDLELLMDDEGEADGP